MTSPCVECLRVSKRRSTARGGEGRVKIGLRCLNKRSKVVRCAKAEDCETLVSNVT